MKSVKFFAALGIALLLLTLHGFWFGESGYFAARALEAEVAEQEQRALALGERNRALAAEVRALKDGFDAVETRARTDLGMVAEGETFYLVLDAPRDEPQR